MVSDSEKDFNFPSELKYNEDSSWVRVENGIAVVGVSSFGAFRAKEFVFIKLPLRGALLKKGDVYVSVEAVKWSGHLSSPVSGEVVEVNDELFDDPARINSDPYGSWIMKVRMKDKKEIEGLMDAESVRKMYKA